MSTSSSRTTVIAASAALAGAASARSVLALAALAAAATAQIVFEPPQTYPVGLGAITAATLDTGDVDGDGDVDVVMSGLLAFDVKLLRNQGDGSFAPAEPVYTLPVFATVNTLLLADLDVDGDLDLAFAAGGLYLMPNDGAGNFGPAVKLHPLPSIVRFAVGELTGDALPDIAVVSTFLLSPLQLAVLPGLGGGDFGDPLVVFGPTPGLGGGPPLLAEFDGDGQLDLALVTIIGGQYELQVLLSGDGFATPVALPLPGPGGLVLADVDGDGATDVLRTDQALDLVEVRLGQGRGAFGPPLTSTTGDDPRQPALADFDGDGILDVATPNHGADDVSVLAGLGDGTFSEVLRVSNAFQPFSLTAVDLDGDGRGDLVVGSGDDVTPLLVLLNHTYTQDSAFSDHGGQGPGGSGFPILLADGQPWPGRPVDLALHNAAPGATAFLALGLSALFAPFGSGVLGPVPDVVFGPFATVAGQPLELGGTWPAGVPAGITLWLQYWLADPAATGGYAPTSTVRLHVP